jgi:hypothetical protein
MRPQPNLDLRALDFGACSNHLGLSSNLLPHAIPNSIPEKSGLFPASTSRLKHLAVSPGHIDFVCDQIVR